MRSKIAQKIYNETPQEVKDKVREYGNKTVKTNMKAFKDFHLYLGAPVKVWFDDGSGKKTIERNGKLSWNHEEDSEWIIWESEDGDDFDEVDFDFKMILRPLNSMDENDVKFLSGYNTFDTEREFLRFEKEKKCAAIYYRWKDERFATNDGYAYSSNAVYYDKEEWAPEQFTYLLSKHFDLFGLIKSNLAVASNKT